MEIEKSARLLYLYQDFIKGAGIQKKAAADRFGVNERSLQRDIEHLRCFFANQTPPGEIIYDARQKVYHLIERDTAHLSNSEVLAVCKILLESRSHRPKFRLQKLPDQFILPVCIHLAYPRSCAFCAFIFLQNRKKG